jgi:cytochrome P450
MSMVDLPLSDVPQIRSWVQRVTLMDTSMDLERARHSLEEGHKNIHDYVEPYIDARLGGKGQDMLSRIVNGRVHGRELTRQEMIDMCTQVMFGGLDTVVNFLGFVFLFLARNPEHRRALAADRGLIPRAVDELLRRFPVVVVGREVKEDTSLDGVPLKKGEMVMMPTPLAGMDERLNVDPLAVDFNRAASRHSTFGGGPHVCPGAMLARTEVRITLEEWLSRIPEFQLTPASKVVFRGGTVGGVTALPLVWSTTAAAA